MSSATPSEPAGFVAKEGIELLTFWTPNGYKISILLEELKAAYGKTYTWQNINIFQNKQKDPWYTAINPNGRIPAIVDHDRSDFAVWESSAILAYLTRHYDPSHHFSFPIDSDDYSRCEQWIAFHHAGVGPMQGQANHFYRLAKERMPYPTQRYVSECERLYGVLDGFLADRDYLVGPGRGKYSIADIANFTWVNVAYFSGVELKKFPNLWSWCDRINAREGVRKGLEVPQVSGLDNKTWLKQLETGSEEFKQKEANLQNLLAEYNFQGEKKKA